MMGSRPPIHSNVSIRHLTTPDEEAQQKPRHLNQLDLNTFKTMKCTNQTPNHNLKMCPDFHDKTKDRRRPLGGYRSELCAYIAKKKVCPQGDACMFCHTRVEEFYHPDKYKAKFCACFNNPSKKCDYGGFCSFAHNEAEVSVDLLDKWT